MYLLIFSDTSVSHKKYYKCFISLKVIELKIVHVLTALIFFSYFYLFKKRKKKENKQA